MRRCLSPNGNTSIRLIAPDEQFFYPEIEMQTISARLLAKFIGTFAFVFIGAGAAAMIGTGPGFNGIAGIAFAHGLTIIAFAFAYGAVLSPF